LYGKGYKNYFQQDSDDNEGKKRDHFIEDPAVLRQRAEERARLKASRKGGHGHGGSQGQGQQGGGQGQHSGGQGQASASQGQNIYYCYLNMCSKFM